MAEVRELVLIALWLIWWPVSKLLHAVVVLLTPFWTLISFILLPLLHIAQTTINIVTLPFSVRWLERIETLYVFLGTAGLIGCITGCILFILFKFISSSLNIDKTIVPTQQDKGRTTADYRAARREKKEESATSSPSRTPVVLRKVTGPRRRGLLSQAIIEEEDSDF